jgi:succinate dehydrogenase flavin-adding protein (antitoxin of CptAB toxin-antitoxin module)
MTDKIMSLKKKIKYKLSYSGTKETDILYKRLFLGKLNKLNKDELILLSELFDEISDVEIFSIIINKSEKPLKYKKLFDKIINE